MTGGIGSRYDRLWLVEYKYKQAKHIDDTKDTYEHLNKEEVKQEQPRRTKKNIESI